MTVTACKSDTERRMVPMPRYDSCYDYGLRGFRQTSPPRFGGGLPPSRRPYASYYDERSQPRIENSVIQRYNSDYVYGARGPRYDRGRYPDEY
jgi:hypothetical protein